MKKLLAILLIIYSPASVPEMNSAEWWRDWNLGAPCSTQTDIIEGTCSDLGIKQKIVWR